MLPSLRRIQLSDIPEAPKWFQAPFLVINSFFQSVWSILNKGITLQDHIRCEIIEITRPAPFEGLKLTTKLQSTTILLLGIKGSELTDPIVLRAHQDGALIVIDSLTGLTAGRTYNLRILVL